MVNDEKDDGMSEKCCDAGRGNIEIYMLIFYQESHRDVHLSPNLFKVYLNDTWYDISSQNSKAGSHGGGDTVSGLMFADDFVGISEAPEGL